jgi:hypothetical protein
VSGCWEDCLFPKTAEELAEVVRDAAADPNVTNRKLELLAGVMGGLSPGLTTCPDTKGSEVAPCCAASSVGSATTAVGDWNGSVVGEGSDEVGS